MNILDGNKINCKAIYDFTAECIREDLSFYFKYFKPFLCILDNDDFASKKYVELKQKTAKECNIKIDIINIDQFIEYAGRYDCCGILQLPASKQAMRTVDDLSYAFTDIDHLDLDNNIIPIIEDRDGYELQKSYPATVLAVMSILNNLFNSLSGKKIAIVGCRSRTVGAFLPEILLKENATLSLYHSKSEIRDNEFETFDVVISCVGKAGIISQKHFGNKTGCVCIDIGVSRGEDGKVKGDFDTDIRENQYYTPYVNGVGLLTRIFLMSNYVEHMFYCADDFSNKANDKYYINEDCLPDSLLLKQIEDQYALNYLKRFIESFKDEERKMRLLNLIEEVSRNQTNLRNANDDDDDDDFADPLFGDYDD